MAISFSCPRRQARSDLCPAKDFLSCLSPRQDAALARERLARRYGPGQVLIHQDTPALAVLSVHSGRVKLTRCASNGHEVVVGLRGPGELLGVREVLSIVPYQISAVTLDPSILCTVPREAFLSVVRDCPELAMRLLRQLAGDYLLAEEQLVARAELSVVARTARLLLALGVRRDDSPGASAAHHVSMSREEMALLVGTTRETLSRVLHQLDEDGAVELENRMIRIVDQSALERRCGLLPAHRAADPESPGPSTPGAGSLAASWVDARRTVAERPSSRPHQTPTRRVIFITRNGVRRHRRSRRPRAE